MDVKVEVNDDGSLPQNLREEVAAINRLYASPEWQAVEPMFTRFIEKLRDQNEQIMEEAQRNFLLGRLYELRRVVELPRHVKEKVEQFKKVALLRQSSPNNGHLEDDDGDGTHE